MVESTALEKRQAGNGLGGSNPPLSANFTPNVDQARHLDNTLLTWQYHPKWKLRYMRGNHDMHAQSALYGNTTTRLYDEPTKRILEESTMKISLGHLLKGLYVKFVEAIKHIYGTKPYIPEADRVTNMNPTERISNEIDLLMATVKNSIILYGRDNIGWLRNIAHGIVMKVPNLFEMQDRYLALQNEFSVKNDQTNIRPNHTDITENEHGHELARRNVFLVYKDMEEAHKDLKRVRSEMERSLLTVAQNLQWEENKQILKGQLGIERYKKATRYEENYEKRSDGHFWETKNPPWTVVTRYIFELDNPDTSRQDSIWLLLLTHTPIETQETFQIVEVRRKNGQAADQITIVADRSIRKSTGTLGTETVQFCTTSVQQMNNDELSTIELFKSASKKKKRP